LVIRPRRICPPLANPASSTKNCGSPGLEPCITAGTMVKWSPSGLLVCDTRDPGLASSTVDLSKAIMAA
jgi:hypothetical protein